MHPEWQAFLEARGARFDEHDGEPCVAAFDDPGDPAGFELTDLSCIGQLCIEGPDAAKFFQGYATADVTEVSADRAVASALCTREGRTIATFRLWGPPDALTLRLHRALIVPVRDLLSRYIVFSKAELREAGDSVVGLGLVGEGAAEAVASVVGRPPEPGEVVRREGEHGERVALRNRGDIDRFELWLPRADAPAIWDALAARAHRVPFSRWLAHRIRAGYVELSPRTAGEYVPQALNLQALGQIAFDKGCYLGQEVVARMQYLGKVKKRLFRYSAEATEGACPALGSPVHAGDPEGEVVGEVVAAATDGGRCEMLAVVRIDHAEDPLFVGRSPLRAEALPYGVPPLREKAS
ncbi:MAG: hypothetical protein V2J24_01410 [Pseudomonadales bacterium]|jgi:folate-binding protein YgfZ|nr:hypothetical protein [Pseudomonadales bacterium]